MKLFGLSNVIYEKTSNYRFDELNESLFIKQVIFELREALGDTFFNFEFFIYSHHNVNKRNPDAVKDTMPPSGNLVSKQKKILLYLSDEGGLDPSDYADKYFAIFKAYIGNKAQASNVFPLALGYVNAVPEFPDKPIKERKYNVFFRGNLNMNRIDFYRTFSRLRYLLPAESITTHEYYRKLLLRIKNDFSSIFEQSIVMFNDGFKVGFSPEKYGEVLSDSKIVLCPKGYFMTECFRHFEAMRAGCVIISEPLPATPFYKESPIIQIENWDVGKVVIQSLLKDEDTMERIHEQTRKWWLEKCSEKATANYIIERLENLAV
ncbi:hypothetical protein SAMN04488057_105306 [Cyclobacterium lianum]|uniref:Exostosin family protein n=1 Tax=Cyclobacterium lianum TaxID=388280 RepID=A0A1M7NH62_9BACT|nr:hypothetical protein [Cyclobacterium lianum]SHN02819.1 hypothetical protein SAMN04488057_105306 [Cyclobacterium lianum]